jgi:hypothetical protein
MAELTVDVFSEHTQNSTERLRSVVSVEYRYMVVVWDVLTVVSKNDIGA